MFHGCVYVLFTEIISKIKEPPPLCRPVVSVDEAPLDVIQILKQAWSEEPERRLTFEEIFKQVKKITEQQSKHFDPELYPIYAKVRILKKNESSFS